MLAVTNGEVSNANITKKLYKRIEHGKLGGVNAIVLHRTGGSTATSAFSTYKNSPKKVGAHFLIGVDGIIYQTARLDKQCWHMGQVYSRCRLAKTCSKADLKKINKILKGKGRYKTKYNNIRKHEAKKKYPDRYPMNSDSIGIEVVGRYLGGKSDKGHFEDLSIEQCESVLWLMNELMPYFKLDFYDDVYAHGPTAHKKENEGVKVYEWLESFK